jgi:cytochrome c biogenesis protein CcmG/thiol:disulfide interchange protein DsbE
VRVSSLSVLLAVGFLSSSIAFGAPPPELAPIKGKVVWVDFWASWCAPCRRSFPWLNTMQRRYGNQGLQIIAVNVDKDRALADKFLKETPAQFALRYDPAGKLAKEFKIQVMPSSFVLDASGKVLASHAGFRLADTDEYERGIRSALAAVAGAQSAN